MTMTALALALSAFILLLLALGDRKRLQVATRCNKGSRSALGSRKRWSLSLLTLAPGVLLGCYGMWSAFLIWLGSICAIGWALAYYLAPGPIQHSRRASRKKLKADHM